MKYILLQGLRYGNKFITTNRPDEDQTRLFDGTVAYKVIGYVDTIEEGQLVIYGRTFPLDGTPPVYR